MRALGVALALLALARPTVAREPPFAGEMAIHAPGGDKVCPVLTFYVVLGSDPPPARKDSDNEPHTLIVLVPGGAPDPAVLGWLGSADPHRTVTVTIHDTADPDAGSTYEVEVARTRFSIGAALHNGAQTFVLTASHLRVNGLQAY